MSSQLNFQLHWGDRTPPIPVCAKGTCIVYFQWKELDSFGNKNILVVPLAQLFHLHISYLPYVALIKKAICTNSMFQLRHCYPTVCPLFPTWNCKVSHNMLGSLWQHFCTFSSVTVKKLILISFYGCHPVIPASAQMLPLWRDLSWKPNLILCSSLSWSHYTV